ncbi:MULTISPECIES: GNAT family N-acetyltransferase [Flavobacterium]|uniref:GNAT family N-acetyltransferase n=2 Tax=Flavobacterium TaxID=237 RepID=A0A2N9PBB0_9FLAO|nr:MULTISPECIES: GNAT family N-acetyltransferase [Flavobacterium]QYS88674.1 GNAT family N-acetyltransferase [Flavobacterium davisii]RVU92148.1 GNAT family N-acetyltransferase [Flavobacterium columnare]SPE77650.1 Protease synthase and sporulation negative regulatory protein PAI 1 [Flavobacterium columnare]
MKIIEVKKEEISVIKKLAYTIWPDTYKEILSVEQIEYMLNLFYNEEALLKQMKKQNFLLLEEKDQFIGFASYEINSKIKKTKLHKIYILPNLQGRGLGRFLLNEIIKRAQEANNLHLFLNVNKYNNALHFYKKIGFQVIADEVIPIGNNYVMDDFVLEKKID